MEMEGSRTFIEVGKKVPLIDLLRGLVIQSGNDATVALAEYIAGTEEGFVDVMNAYASEMGLSNTLFKIQRDYQIQSFYKHSRFSSAWFKINQ